MNLEFKTQTRISTPESEEDSQWNLYVYLDKVTLDFLPLPVPTVHAVLK